MVDTAGALDFTHRLVDMLMFLLVLAQARRFKQDMLGRQQDVSAGQLQAVSLLEEQITRAEQFRRKQLEDEEQARQQVRQQAEQARKAALSGLLSGSKIDSTKSDFQ